jgi:hypothetical protein
MAMRHCVSILRLGLIAVVALSGLSCSDSASTLNPVQGKVLLNGQPLAGALVTLHLKDGADIRTVPSTGLSKEDGTFTIMTGDKAGAPAGSYVVTIICSEVVKSKEGVISTGPPETQDRLKGAYADRAKSSITVEVKKGPNQLEPFDLK